MLQKLPIHQYQRYGVLRKILNEIRVENETFQILEVGAGAHRNAEKFLPNDRFIYLDILVPLALKNDPDFIEGDATDLIFLDNSFDYLVALDVFEHIPSDLRNKFLNEMLRVSKNGIIISAPFSEYKADIMEKNLDDFFHRMNGKSEITWLKEHLEMGLPSLKETVSYLEKECQVELITFNHGNYDITEKLLKIELMATVYPQMIQELNDISLYYNQKIFEDDFDPDGSRTFILAFKNSMNSRDSFGNVSSKFCRSEDAKILELENRMSLGLGLFERDPNCSLFDEKNEEPLVDILVVSYNHQDTIKRALDSILMQKCDFNYRVIICDDCSTDQTFQIIRDYTEQYNCQFKLLKRHMNIGITKNYKRGFLECTSKYVAILEGDDFWSSPNKLQKQVEFLEKNSECAICFSRIVLYNEESKTFIKYNLKNQELRNGRNIFTTSDLARENFIGNFSCCMYRNASLKLITDEIFELKAYDWAINMVISEKGGIGFLDEILSVYSINPQGSWSSINDKDKTSSLIEIIQVYDSFFHYAYSKEFVDYTTELKKERQRINHSIFRKKWKKMWKKFWR